MPNREFVHLVDIGSQEKHGVYEMASEDGSFFVGPAAWLGGLAENLRSDRFIGAF